jgi:hypothetical protein
MMIVPVYYSVKRYSWIRSIGDIDERKDGKNRGPHVVPLQWSLFSFQLTNNSNDEIKDGVKLERTGHE